MNQNNIERVLEKRSILKFYNYNKEVKLIIIIEIYHLIKCK